MSSPRITDNRVRRLRCSLQSLCLGITGQDCEVTHVVVSGDNCEAIAQAAGTTYDIILANNPNVNSACTNIYPGEVRVYDVDIGREILLIGC